MYLISRRIAHDDIEDQKLSHHKTLWPQARQWCREAHEQRARKIRFYFQYQRTRKYFG